MSIHSVRSIAIAIAMVSFVAMFSGCSTYVRIRSLEPAPVNFGMDKTIDILHTTGRRSARETVIARLISIARSGGYWRVQDKTEQGIEVKITGRSVSLSDGTMVPAGTAGMRIDVLEWQTGSDIKTTEYKDSKGVRRTRSYKVKTASVLLGVTLFNRTAKALLAEKEFNGVAEMSGSNADKDTVLQMAANNAVRALLRQITPHAVTLRVKLDDSDKRQKHILDAATAGNLTRATMELKTYLAKNPNNPAALYNLAVFTDAAGDYPGALALYDRAIKFGNKPWYATARRQCAGREAKAKSMANGD